AGMTLNDVVMLKLAGGPDLIEPWTLAQQGIEQKPGSSYIDPVTGQIRFIPKAGEGITLQDGRASPVPGYAQAQAEIAAAQAGATAAAQEAAKYPYDVGRLEEQAKRDPMQVVDPVSGNTEYRPRADVAQGGATAAINPTTVAARADLGKVETQANNMLRTIDQLLTHPGLEAS